MAYTHAYQLCIIYVDPTAYYTAGVLADLGSCYGFCKGLFSKYVGI